MRNGMTPICKKKKKDYASLGNFTGFIPILFLPYGTHRNPNSPPGGRERLLGAPHRDAKAMACGWLVVKRFGGGSKKRHQNGTLVSGPMDQNLRNPSC